MASANERRSAIFLKPAQTRIRATTSLTMNSTSAMAIRHGSRTATTQSYIGGQGWIGLTSLNLVSPADAAPPKHGPSSAPALGRLPGQRLGRDVPDHLGEPACLGAFRRRSAALRPCRLPLHLPA